MTKNNLALFITLFLIVLLMPSLAMAQEKMVEHRGEQWIQYNNLTHLNEKWTLFGNTGVRWRDGFEKFSIFFARVGAAYNLSGRIRLATGFTFVELYDDGDRYKVEMRPYEEVILRDNSVHTLKFNHRFRFEQRFNNPVVDGKIQSDNTFAIRLRYALMTGFDLFQLSKDNPHSKFRINISDEVMFNGGKEIVHNIFDKNRFVISPTLQLNQWVSIALAWNNQFASTTTAGQYVNTNALWFHLTHTINLSKKEIKDLQKDFPQLPSSSGL